MELPEKIYDIVVARLKGGILPEDEKRLQDWLDESEQNRRMYNEFCALWYGLRWGSNRETVDKSKGWTKILQLKRRRKFHRLSGRISVAASVCLILGVAGFYLHRMNEIETPSGSLSENPTGVTLVLSSGDKINVRELKDADIQELGMVVHSDSSFLKYRQGAPVLSDTLVFNELIVPKCGEYRLQLADGSQVVMNSESRLRFPVEFVGDRREVYLEGEACFEVVKDASKPFIVHTAEMDVRVLGTLFNVSAYKDDEQTEVTLVDGRVAVDVGKDVHNLTPGKQFMLDNETQRFAIREVDALNYIAWTKGVFRFDAMPLKQLMKELTRWYDISYEFRKASLEKVRFTGGVRKYDDIGDIIKMIGEITEVDLIMEGNKVIIDKKQ